MTDYKQLCTELLDWLNFYNLSCNTDASTEQLNRAVACADKARAELAEPEGPTDEEIMELMPQQMRDDLAAAARALVRMEVATQSSFDLNYIKAASTFRIILNRHVVDHARAVLTKWSRQ